MGCCTSQSETEKQRLVSENKPTNSLLKPAGSVKEQPQPQYREDKKEEVRKEEAVHLPPQLPSTASIRRRSSAVPPLITSPAPTETTQKESASNFESIRSSYHSNLDVERADSAIPDLSIKTTTSTNQQTPDTPGSAANSSVTASNAFKKRAVALWDYSGNDEYDQLAFKAGDEIIVIEEDEESGWWWGDLNGKEGYFPVNYTEVHKPEIKINQGNIDPKIKALQATLAKH